MRAPADRHASIVNAAIKLFRQKNYHGTTMKDIAYEVGINQGSLYHYIDSKEELLFDIVDRAISRINEALSGLKAEQIPATEKLRRIIYHHVNYLVNHQPEHAIMMEDTKHLSEEFQVKIQKVQKQYEQEFQSIIEEGIQKGEFKELHPKVTFALLGMMNWTYRWYSAQGDLSVGELARVFEELILGGLSKTG